MTRTEVLAYARTLEFVPPCLHWGTCQACGVTVWWADWHGAAMPYEFGRHSHPDGVVGNVIHGGHCLIDDLERDGRIAPNPPRPPYALQPRSS